MQSSSDPALRQVIHQIEKALLMEPRREVFSVDVAERAVSRLLAAQEAPTAENALERRWAFDVLSLYFGSVREGADARVDRARSAFASARAEALVAGERTRPFPYEDVPRSGVAIESFERLLAQRKSVRWFEDWGVERTLLDQAIEAASLAPSACNAQLYDLRIACTQETVASLVPYLRGGRGWVHKAPVIVCFIGRFDYLGSPSDRHLPYIDGALAAGNMILALEALGLASCVINWPGVAEDDVGIAPVLGLENYQRVMFSIAIGYPRQEASVASSPRKPISVTRCFLE